MNKYIVTVEVTFDIPVTTSTAELADHAAKIFVKEEILDKRPMTKVVEAKITNSWVDNVLPPQQEIPNDRC